MSDLAASVSLVTDGVMLSGETLGVLPVRFALSPDVNLKVKTIDFDEETDEMVCILTVSQLDKLMRKNPDLWGENRKYVTATVQGVHEKVKHRALMLNIAKELPRYIACPLRNAAVHHTLYYGHVRRLKDHAPIAWPCFTCGGSHRLKPLGQVKGFEHPCVSVIAKCELN